MRTASAAGLGGMILTMIRRLLFVTLLTETAHVTALTCPAGNYDAGQSSCLPCPAGAFCPDGATPPLLCPIGFACLGPGMSFPQLCAGGQSYCPAAGLTLPLPCPAGNMSTPGASSCLSAVVSTFAGNGGTTFVEGASAVAAFNKLSGVAVDISGNVLVADQTNSRVRRIAPNGGTLSIGSAVVFVFVFLPLTACLLVPVSG